jgi:hypothetical protein
MLAGRVFPISLLVQPSGSTGVPGTTVSVALPVCTVAPLVAETVNEYEPAAVPPAVVISKVDSAGPVKEGIIEAGLTLQDAPDGRPVTEVIVTAPLAPFMLTAPRP